MGAPPPARDMEMPPREGGMGAPPPARDMEMPPPESMDTWDPEGGDPEDER